jgi:PAS domain S-box-containing protein
MDTDRNLLFGVLALQADLIDATQFIEACLLWTTRKKEHLADLLLERGWIQPADRVHVEYLLERKLHKHGGNTHASLAAIPDDIKTSLAALDDEDVQRSLAGVPLSAEAPPVATIDHVPAQAERYSRLHLHATGGIGRVWLAHDSALGRDVALKELRPERAEHATLGARFLQEAQITGQLEHPGIIPVYELVRGRDGQQPFYTMRFVKGRTLSDAARAYHDRRSAAQADALELPALLNAFVTVCNTVAYAHSRGVIHRDLKGQNVILGDFGEVVVLDWGLAKLVGRPEGEVQAPSVILDEAGSKGSGYTVAGQALGTPGYMSPEQAAGRLDLIDRRTDVYGLGAILYEILTGAPPFTGDSAEEVLHKVREEIPARPRQLWPEIPPALEALCLRALAKRPADRPSAAAELAHEVQGWQEFERRKAEVALRESEALYRSLVDILPLALARKDLQSRFTFMNKRGCQSFNKPLEEILGRTDFDFLPVEIAEDAQQGDRQVIETGQTLETPIFSYIHMGEERYFHSIKSPVRDSGGQIIGVQVVIWDVTERKRLEEALRESEALYHSLVETLPLCVWRKDLKGRFIFGNRRFCESLGHTVDQVIGKTDFDFFPPDLAEKYRQDDARVHQTGMTYATEEQVTTRSETLFVEVVKSPIFDAAGQVIGTQGIYWDITERKRGEEALRKSRERYELAVLGSQDGLWDWDIEANEVYYSPRYKEMLGYKEHEYWNRPGEWRKRLHPDDYARAVAAHEAHVAGLTPYYESEHRLRRKDGTYRWFRGRGVALRDAAGKAYRMAGSLEDITDRKIAEEELARLRHLLDREGIPCSADTVDGPAVPTRIEAGAPEQDAVTDQDGQDSFPKTAE